MALTIANIIPGVLQKLGNRSDLNGTPSLVSKWISEAAIELSVALPFPQLQFIGPIKTFTVATPETTYPISNYVANVGDDIAFVDAFWVWWNGATGSGYNMKYRTPAVVNVMAQMTKAPPMYWTRYGMNFIFGPNPDKAYSHFIMYQKKHAFSTPAVSTDPILLEPEWATVLEYAAAIKGAPEVQMAEMMTTWQSILHGNPNDPRQPGLIKPLLTQFQRDASNNERQLSVVIG